MNPLKPTRVEKYYDAHVAEEWERLKRHRTEFAVTLRAFDEFLPPPPISILDIGGGPGRYALVLTEMGYNVTLLDLSQSNLDHAMRMAVEQALPLPQIIHGNALKMDKISDSAYDAVLLMGPLYHLNNEEERSAAVNEAGRVLKPGGLIFSSIITRYAPFRDYSAEDPQTVFNDRKEWDQMLIDGINWGEGFPDAYFALPGELRLLMESQGFSTMQILGVEGIAAGHEDKLNLLEGAAWEYWVDLNYRFAKDPALHAAADHLLYIGRKQ